jgi:two-component system chemotaxis sensor kinase CheA
MDESLLESFTEEALEHLGHIEEALLQLEDSEGPGVADRVNTIFRGAHSIKGAAGFLNLTTIRELSHRLETVLDKLRHEELKATSAVISTLLSAFDRLKTLVVGYPATEGAPIADVLRSLEAVTNPDAVPGPSSEPAAPQGLAVPLRGTAHSLHISQADLELCLGSGKKVYLVAFEILHDGPDEWSGLFDQLNRVGVLMDRFVDWDAAEPRFPLAVTSVPLWWLVRTGTTSDGLLQAFDRKPLVFREIPLDKPAAPPAAPVPAAAEAREEVGGGLDHDKAKPGEGSLRVQVALLERLMNLAGELVLARNQLNEALKETEEPALKAARSRVHAVTAQLQVAVMKTRLQPLSVISRRLPRILRDVGLQTGKQLRLEVIGEEVEMDKTIIEALGDPLTHLIRNAGDHGIEAPQDREAAGKAPEGLIVLRGYHEAGQVILEVADDGKGMDAARILAKAVDLGKVSAERASTLTPEEVLQLVFLPGLSTAETVSQLSGRGVGMDVVKSNLERIGGVVELSSVRGKGTTVRIKLPLTLAIIPSVLVTIGSERMAIPQVSVQELIRLPGPAVAERVFRMGTEEVLSLRGSYLPLVKAWEALGIGRADQRHRLADRRAPDLLDSQPVQAAAESRSGQDRRAAAEAPVNIVVLSTGNFRYGLVVDDLHDTMEIVVKPLGNRLSAIKAYAGATIMGDGKVSLILDAGGIAAQGNLRSVAKLAEDQGSRKAATVDQGGETHNLLLFSSGTEACGLALDAVLRIDPVTPERIESNGKLRILDFHGRPVVLFEAHEAVSLAPLDWTRPVNALSMHLFERTVALLVNGPVEAVQVKAVFDAKTLRSRGILGSLHWKGKTTMILDPIEILEALHPDWKAPLPGPSARGRGPSILLAEDSDFFRNNLVSALSKAGYRVTAAADGTAALETFDGPETFDLVVSDIEMPNLDGLGLARAIRQRPKGAKLPLVAVTTLASQEDHVRGLEAGFNEYLVKLNVEVLLATIRKLLSGARV